MKILIRILAIILALSCCVLTIGCGSDEEPETEVSDRDRVITFTDTVLLKDGASSVKLVLPQRTPASGLEKGEARKASAKEELAASEFNELFSLSTGVRLEIVYDDQITYDKNDSYIFIGKSDKFLTQFGITPNYNELGGQGFLIKNQDKSVVITGADMYGYGTVYGVYEYLSWLIDFEQYADNEVYVKPVSSVNFLDYSKEFKDKPDIPNKLSAGEAYSSNQLFRVRNRMVQMTTDLFLGGMSPYHTSFVFFPKADYNDPAKEGSYHPKWYAPAGDQLCWQAQGDKEEYQLMLDTFFEKVKTSLMAYPALQHVGFSLQDTTTWCTCATCAQIKIDYGANSASCVMFLNNISEMFEAWFKTEEGQPYAREIDFVFLAYKGTASAPAVKQEDGTYVPTIKCRDNVYPFVCTFSSTRSQPVNSPVNVQKGIYGDVEAWGSVSSRMALWTYSANYNNFMAFCNPFDAMAEDYKYYATKNPVYHLDETQGGNYYASSFTQLSYWLKSKFAWNVNADLAALTDEYFQRYFQDANEPMRKYYDELRLTMTRAYDIGGYDHYDNSNPMSKEFFTYGMLMQWQGYIDQAYASIEYLKNTDSVLYNKLYTRITVEKCAITYAIITLYGNDNYSASEHNALCDELEKDCDTAKILEFFEGKNNSPKDVIAGLRR